VALEAGEEMIVHAEGNSAQIVAMGVAAAVVVLAVGIGLGARRCADRLLEWFD